MRKTPELSGSALRMRKSVNDVLPFSMDRGMHYHRTIDAQIEMDAPAARYCDVTGCRSGLRRLAANGSVAAGSDLRTNETRPPALRCHWRKWLSMS